MALPSPSAMAWVDLLSELLASPSSSPAQDQLSLAHRLSLVIPHAPSRSLPSLTAALLVSPRLWHSPPGTHRDTLDPVQFSFLALRHAALLTFQLALQSSCGAPFARRRVARFVQCWTRGLTGATGEPELLVRRLALLAAPLSALHAFRRSEPAVARAGSRVLAAAEAQTWADLGVILGRSPSPAAAWAGPDAPRALTWLVAILVPDMASAALRCPDAEVLVGLLGGALCGLSHDRALLDDLGRSIQRSGGRILIRPGSVAASSLARLTGEPLHVLVGRVGLSLGRVFQEAYVFASGGVVLGALASLEGVLRAVSDAWQEAVQNLGDVVLPPFGGDACASLDTWLDGLLVSAVCVLGGLANALHAAPPDHAPPLGLLRVALQCLQYLHFLVLRFPPGRLQLHHETFVALAGVVNKQTADLAAFLSHFEPPEFGVQPKDPLQTAWAAFYCDLLEQVASTVPEHYLQSRALPFIQPLLTLPVVAEAAHAAALRLLPRCDAQTLGSFGRTYFDILIADPVHLPISESQQRMAFQAVVKLLLHRGHDSLDRHDFLTKLIKRAAHVSRDGDAAGYRIRLLRCLIDWIQALPIHSHELHDTLDHVWAVFMGSAEEVKLLFEGLSGVQDRNHAVKWWLKKRADHSAVLQARL